MRRLNGTPASSGRVEGRAAVHSGGNAPALRLGDVLVTEITDPSMFVQILEHAAGIVTDLGGITSHPAIIARELGIPCVVGVGTATIDIPPGAIIIVDGDVGVVEVKD